VTDRALVYARISRDDLGDGAGVARQHEDCLTLCSRRGWQVVEQVTDNDVSAFSGRHRPGYARLLELVEQGRVDVVVAWAPERLHRSPRQLEDFIELVERSGTAVETVKAGAWDVSTSHGRLVARMLGAVSRAESERTGERVSRAHQQAKTQGLWRGPIPFGMRASGRPGAPEPDPEAAQVVQQVVDRVLRGDALSRIARDLNSAGIRPRRGVAWTHTGIDRLLACPAIGGLVQVDGELRPAAFTGLVSEQQWRAARAALARRPRGEVRRPREVLTLLGGLLRCVEHGHVCHGGGTEYSRVYTAAQPGQCYIRIPRLPADHLVQEVVVERLSQPDARDLLRPPVDLDGLDAEAQNLRQRREELANLVAEGLVPGSVARPKLEDIASRLSKLEGQRNPAALPADALVDPRSAWESWTMPQRREVLQLLFDSITLRHAQPNQGPRADLTRLQLDWAK
jgi:site-specific DNA recombinase